MAFAKGTESTEAVEIKKYVGVASVNIIGLNPTKKELGVMYDRELDTEPEYIGVTELGEEDDKKPYNQIRLDFIVKTDKDPVLVSKISFFLVEKYRFNKDETKIQVIDKYGRTAWVTIEQAKNKEIPMYSNGPANLDSDYRAAYIGESELTDFLKAFLVIPNVMNYVNKMWVMKDNPSDSESRLEHIANYFKGDIKELKNILALRSTNKVKVMFGIRTTNDNKQYQVILNQVVQRNDSNHFNDFSKVIGQIKESGRLANVDCFYGNIKEYVIENTDFSSPEVKDSNPFEF